MVFIILSLWVALLSYIEGKHNLTIKYKLVKMFFLLLIPLPLNSLPLSQNFTVKFILAPQLSMLHACLMSFCSASGVINLWATAAADGWWMIVE